MPNLHLVRVALANHQYLAAEVAQIDETLGATFGLKPLEAAKLRAECEALERDVRHAGVHPNPAR